MTGYLYCWFDDDIIKAAWVKTAFFYQSIMPVVAYQTYVNLADTAVSIFIIATI
ncbi:hypothetical protein AAIR29_10570 [Psychrobacter sp. FBL11]|uniref:Uncharacterized protein n=1 Tax=Psychrobacter saeujeotis TaxID=3143436 RepID=A0ABU9X9H8_9GAMM|nr:hypothetical protein [uncultured Psychrobacter sp.]